MEAPSGAIEGLKRMVDPMNETEFHQFREVIADMTGDASQDRDRMTDKVGLTMSAEMADSIARLDQRPLMKG